MELVPITALIVTPRKIDIWLPSNVFASKDIIMLGQLSVGNAVIHGTNIFIF